MLPEYEDFDDGFVCSVVYGYARDSINELMDKLYLNGVEPEDMYDDIYNLIESLISKVSSAGRRQGASLSEVLAEHVIDWYYEEENDVVQFCIDSYVPPTGKRSVSRCAKGSAPRSKSKGRTSSKKTTKKASNQRKPASRGGRR